MIETPVSLRLSEFIPEACQSCDQAFDICVNAARAVRRGQCSYEEARDNVVTDIETQCPGGPLIRASGWGKNTVACRITND